MNIYAYCTNPYILRNQNFRKHGISSGTGTKGDYICTRKECKITNHRTEFICVDKTFTIIASGDIDIAYIRYGFIVNNFFHCLYKLRLFMNIFWNSR